MSMSDTHNPGNSTYSLKSLQIIIELFQFCERGVCHEGVAEQQLLENEHETEAEKQEAPATDGHHRHQLRHRLLPGARSQLQ